MISPVLSEKLVERTQETSGRAAEMKGEIQTRDFPITEHFC